MTPQPARIAAQEQQRLVQRCVIDFLLGEVSRMTARHGGDLIGGAVFLAVRQATAPPLSPLGRPGERIDPARTVSVRAVAQSLKISYETTRRRMIALEADGLVRRLGGAGVAVTAQAFDRPAFREGADQVHAAALHLYDCLGRLGLIFPPPPKPPRLNEGDLDLAVAGLVGDFILRVVEIRALQHSSMLSGLVFAAFMSGNADPLTYDLELAHRYSRADNPPPDSARRPVTITEVAKRVGQPHEVVRRRVLELIAQDKMHRVTGGYLVNMEVLQSPHALEGGLLINQRFVQMTQGLLGLGLDPRGSRPSL